QDSNRQTVKKFKTEGKRYLGFIGNSDGFIPAITSSCIT
ncbi:hypothetical protein Trydic_g1829, partial [Trypoxylus dichotomus]